MKTADKVYAVMGFIGAAGMFGASSAIFNNGALPMWARITVEVLSVLNLASMIYFISGMFRKNK